mgnify:CR=1 FL=1
MKFNITIILGLASMLFLPYIAIAKSIVKTSSARMRIPGVASFRIENANAVEHPTGVEMEDVYNKGFYEFKNQPELTLQSNTSWTLTVSASNIVAPAGVTKTAEDFKIKHDQSKFSDGGFYNSYKSVTGTSTIASSDKKLPISILTMNYAMDVDEENDTPGDYGVTLTYTFTSPS